MTTLLNKAESEGASAPTVSAEELEALRKRAAEQGDKVKAAKAVGGSWGLWQWQRRQMPGASHRQLGSRGLPEMSSWRNDSKGGVQQGQRWCAAITASPQL